jgi:hypothetical protein
MQICVTSAHFFEVFSRRTTVLGHENARCFAGAVDRHEPVRLAQNR